MLAADRLCGEVIHDDVNSEERDAFHQTIALAAAADWLNKRALAEFFEQARAGKKEARS